MCKRCRRVKFSSADDMKGIFLRYPAIQSSRSNVFVNEL